MKCLFVCTGNICRSPTADGVLRRRLEALGLGDAVVVDSAATHAYHVGEAPDGRTVAHARKRGYELGMLRARLVTQQDFYDFDLILAMDKGHYGHLQRMKPHDATAELALFLPYAGVADMEEVPDPYYGGAGHFEQVLDVVERAVEGMLPRIHAQLEAKG